MSRRGTITNAVVAGLFGLVVSILAVDLALIYGVFSPVGGPEQLVHAGLAATVSGGIVVGVPVFVLFERSILGWNPPDDAR